LKFGDNIFFQTLIMRAKREDELKAIGNKLTITGIVFTIETWIKTNKEKYLIEYDLYLYTGVFFYQTLTQKQKKMFINWKW